MFDFCRSPLYQRSQVARWAEQAVLAESVAVHLIQWGASVVDRIGGAVDGKTLGLTVDIPIPVGARHTAYRESQDLEGSHMDQSVGWAEGRTGDMRTAVVDGNYVPAFAFVAGYWSSEVVVWAASEVVPEKILAFGVEEL